MTQYAQLGDAVLALRQPHHSNIYPDATRICIICLVCGHLDQNWSSYYVNSCQLNREVVYNQ